MSASAGEASIECLLLPVGAGDWLLPAVCVVEVVRYRPLARVAAPDACIGLLGWQDGDVPVIDVARLERDRAQAVAAWPLIAVLNRTAADAPWPFWAVALSNLPRRRRMFASSVALAEVQAAGCPGSWVVADSGRCLIPDLAWLQREQLPPLTWS
ncbi:MAG: hypothetical protein ACO377_02430 [Pseudomonadales bacterium]